MPATPTYVALAEATLVSAVASIVIPVPSGYRDLVFVFDGTAANADERLQFNGDTGANYNWVRMYGTGSSTASSTATNVSFIRNSGGDLTPRNNTIIQIFDVSATDKHKTTLGRGNNPSEIVMATAGRWASTAAITSITYSLSTGSFQVGSTFKLFGIEA